MNEVALTTLVIDSRKLQHLKMDGPALKVTMHGRSPMLFPLRRLSRVHILGIPEVGMDALLFCAEQQVPVAFFHHSGRLRCRLQPAVTSTTLPDHWLEHVEFDPEIAQLYEDWVLHQELYVIASLGINKGARESRRKILVEGLRHFCRERLGRGGLKEALEWLEGQLRFHLEHTIETFGFTQHRGRARLLADMLPLGQLQLLFSLANRLLQGEMQIHAQTMTAFYQAHAVQVEYTARRMLTQLVYKLEAVI